MCAGRLRSIVGLVVVVLSVGMAASSAMGETVYVKEGGTGGGTSWADAYGDLQDALDAATGDPNQIWVSAGTYKPTYDYGLGIGNRGKHFRMINGVGIYGGFPDVGDPGWEDRDPDTYVTILSGDLLGNDEAAIPVKELFDDPNRADNCYHVFYHPEGLALDPNAILDGFTITGGNGDDSGHRYGGGMYNWGSSPIVTGCTFTANSASRGGGMYNYASSPTVAGCTFTGNLASWYGSGMSNWHYSDPTVTGCTFNGNLADCGSGIYNNESSPTVMGCTFSGNLADCGGGIFNIGFSSPTVTGCILSGNSAVSLGGGMYNDWESSPTVTGCTFTSNSADDGGGMSNYYSSHPTLTNCILWGNTAVSSGNEIYHDSSIATISYCDIDGCGGSGAGWNEDLGIDLGGNIDADPLFVDADGLDNLVGTEDDNLRLLVCSPCVDVGTNSTSPPLPATDLDGNARIVNGTVDMGAYETSNNEPFICLSTSLVQLKAYESDTNACGKMFSMFSIRNGGGGTLHWTITASSSYDWLTITPMGGSSTGETDEVTLGVDTSGLAVGDYNCDLTILADGALNSPETVHVVLEVLDLAPSIPMSLAYEAQCYSYVYATTSECYCDDPEEGWDTGQDSSINDKAECGAGVTVSSGWDYEGCCVRSVIKTEVEGCYGGYGGRLVSNIQGYGETTAWHYPDGFMWPEGGYGSGYTSLAGMIDIGEGLPPGTPDVITLTADAIVSGDDPSRWYNWDWWLKIWDDDPGTPLMQLDGGNTSAELSVPAGQILHFEFYVEAEEDDWPWEGLDSTIQIDLGVIIPNVADVNGDYRVDLADFGIVSGRWMEAGCNEGNDFCSGVDIDQMGDVGLGDLFILAGNWLAGVPGSV